MKTIVKLLIIAFSFLLLSCSEQKPVTLILQATGTDVTGQQLRMASGIITNRLKIYGLHISAIPEPDKYQIKIEMTDTVRPADINNLLTVPGQVGFYETLLVNSNSKLACSSFEDKKVEDSVRISLVNTLNDNYYKLVWSLPDSHAETCLYALETDSSGNPLLSQTDIESASSSKDGSSEFYRIDIKFKSSSAKTWALLTGRSVGKPVAIVVDDKVIFNPVVRDPIETGSCEMTGNFTKKEADYFTALINSGPLPVKLTLKD